jgi:hypothetical protein
MCAQQRKLMMMANNSSPNLHEFYRKQQIIFWLIELLYPIKILGAL